MAYFLYNAMNSHKPFAQNPLPMYLDCSTLTPGLSASGTGSSLANMKYYVCYTYVNSFTQETTKSQYANITPTAGQNIVVTLTPGVNATNIKVYMATVSGTDYLQTTLAGNATTVTLTAYSTVGAAAPLSNQTSAGLQTYTAPAASATMPVSNASTGIPTAIIRELIACCTSSQGGSYFYVTVGGFNLINGLHVTANDTVIFQDLKVAMLAGEQIVAYSRPASAYTSSVPNIHLTISGWEVQ